MSRGIVHRDARAAEYLRLLAVGVSSAVAAALVSRCTCRRRRPDCPSCRVTP